MEFRKVANRVAVFGTSCQNPERTDPASKRAKSTVTGLSVRRIVVRLEIAILVFGIPVAVEGSGLQSKMTFEMMGKAMSSA